MERSRAPPVQPQKLEAGGLRGWCSLCAQGHWWCLPRPPSSGACTSSCRCSASCWEHLIQPGLPVPVQQTVQPFWTFRSPSWRFVSFEISSPMAFRIWRKTLHVTCTPHSCAGCWLVCTACFPCACVQSLC